MAILVFALDVDGRPTLTFEASSTRDARRLCNEEWLRTDLSLQTSNGSPLCGSDSKLSIRRPTADELEVFYQSAETATRSEELLLAYLVELDDRG
jgi:hypothetical protein